MPPVVPSPDQLPIFEELVPAIRPRRPHLRIQPPLLADLTARQRKAVTHGDGPLLIVAGAGTGKTRTLVYRLAHLVRRGVPADRILLLTFTRRAAQEMLRRAERITEETLSRAVRARHHTSLSRYHSTVSLASLQR